MIQSGIIQSVKQSIDIFNLKIYNYQISGRIEIYADQRTLQPLSLLRRQLPLHRGACIDTERSSSP